ncbi:putative Zn-binding protein involved in type VI secretion [Chitinivorax tropicus]|uniref:Putative Zn-binding protein involved in type VI secretion n=1 Tax=Chitinivorax tropicus TaxID=714531 RepID=A0A840MP88_9PROT|nr:PAAR domain-containing protein [Chitinivorax tropicus]MBB5018306.1 putative Zn-binding protein involved in type VI secretion [Chitinivorax tropicus]
MIPLIVLGDKTTHGGTVITADTTSDINGKPMARVGDMVVCPLCKGVFPITTGSPDYLDPQGNGYARHNDETACGAKLIASQTLVGWRNPSTLGQDTGGPPPDIAKQAIATTTDSGLCLDCLLKATQSGSALVIRE